MDFAPSPRAAELLGTLQTFMTEHVLPAEPVYERQRRELAAAGRLHDLPPVVEELKAEARDARAVEPVPARPMSRPARNSTTRRWPRSSGRSPELAPGGAATAPRPTPATWSCCTMFGTAEQQEQWLRPAARRRDPLGVRDDRAGRRVVGRHATSRTSIARDGDDYVINGRKWWIDRRARPALRGADRDGQDRPGAPSRTGSSRWCSCPMDTPGRRRRARPAGLRLPGPARPLRDRRSTDVRVPAANLLGEEGGGFAIAQARLGPGRIHHCMRAIGVAERALELMCRRAHVARRVRQAARRPGRGAAVDRRVAHRDRAGPAAHAEDRLADRHRRAPRRARDRDRRRSRSSVPQHGAAGHRPRDPGARRRGRQRRRRRSPRCTPAPRTLRLADGPDEVHLRSIARAELGKYVARLTDHPTPPGDTSLLIME